MTSHTLPLPALRRASYAAALLIALFIALTPTAYTQLIAGEEEYIFPIPGVEASTAPKIDYFARARELQSHIVTFDSHLDVNLGFGDKDHSSLHCPSPQLDLEWARAGELKGGWFATFGSQRQSSPATLTTAKADAESKYRSIIGIAKSHPDRAEIAYTPSDLRRIEEAGKFAIVLSILNTYPLGSDLSQLDAWQRRGVRVVGFVHAGNNQWADSSRPNGILGDKPNEHNGLTTLGRQAVTRLNDLGVLIDVSQLTTKALQDVLAASKAPVVATHSGIRSIVNVSRNLSDEELKAVADKGGVVQIVAFSAYLAPLPQSVQDEVARVNAKYDIHPDRSAGSADPAKYKAWSAEYHEALAKAPKATISQYVDSIDYAVQKISIDHVGIASDFNHGGGVIGWKDESEAPNVTAELLRRGYTNEQIAKLWGENFLRVWGEAQQHTTVARAKHQHRPTGE